MTDDNLYAHLKRVFHEPNRLAIMSALAGYPRGLTFTQIKKECDLTDGNLSRHLSTLEEAKVITIDKKFVRSKPRTTVRLTDRGHDDFVEYLNTLANVLLKASEALESPKKKRGEAPLSGAVEA